MPIFHYWIRNAAGEAVQGYREALAESELREWFARRGALLLSAQEVRPGGAAGGLSEQTAEALLREVADAQAAELPLDVALEAAAMNTPDQHLASALAHLAARLRSGVEWREALREIAMPEAHRAILEATASAARPAAVLLEMLEVRQWYADFRRNLWRSLLYPLVCTVMAVVIFSFVVIIAGKILASYISEFALQQSWGVELLLWWANYGGWTLLAELLVALLTLVMVRSAGGPVLWHQFLMTVPVIGVPIQYAAFVPLLRCTALFLRQKMPLDQALLLAARASPAPISVQPVEALARRIRAGGYLVESLVDWGTFPRCAIPFIAWGENHGTMVEGLEAAAELLMGAAQTAALSARALLFPILTAFTVCMALSAAAAIFGPMTVAIDALSK